MAHPEATEHLVDEKLDFVFRKLTPHLRQVSKHVRHHQVAEEKESRDEEILRQTARLLSLSNSPSTIKEARSQGKHKKDLPFYSSHYFYYRSCSHPVNALIPALSYFQ